MCQLCGGGARSHAVSITVRPRQVLGGISWNGSFEEAAAGAIDRAIAAVRDFGLERTSAWQSPVVGLSRSHGIGAIDYFSGVLVDDGEILPKGFERLELAETIFACSWHGPLDGDVVEHYSRMIEWLRDSGYRRETVPFHQREEYPPHVDLALPPELRLMLPIAERLDKGSRNRP